MNKLRRWGIILCLSIIITVIGIVVVGFAVKIYNVFNPPRIKEINADEIDAIQFIFTGGAPKNGYDSKIITNEDVIKRMVEALTLAKVGKRMYEPLEGGYTNCYFFSDGMIVHELELNGVQTTQMRFKTGYFEVQYSAESLGELYDNSIAEAVTVEYDLYKNYPEITLSEVYESIKYKDY